MIALGLPAPALWALRWLLFLGPLAAAAILARQSRGDRRALVAALFSFLYGIGAVFAAHRLAIALGWWRYGGDALMVEGIPADVWLGGALLFGPVSFLAVPRANPLWLTLPVVLGLHGLFFGSLPPLVYPGPNWFLGVLVVFASAHIPALYLARWTARGCRLPERAALLAVGHGLLAFGVLPCLILRAMDGRWDLFDRPAWVLAACAASLLPLFVLGLSAVQFFVTYGEGTPIPLDPTRRLVRGGVFAYVSNPMQLCSAASWIVIGVALASVWVAAAALMAWVFVLGMVRWHHRHDLLVRFPEGWPAYRANVPEWVPRWRPWIAEPGVLGLDPASPAQMRFGRWLERSGAVGLRVEPAPGAGPAYADGTRAFDGWLAVARALQHVDLAWALVGAAGLLALWPLADLQRRVGFQTPRGGLRGWLRRFSTARHA